MINWRDSILNHFQPGISKLTLAADPDSLLTEEKLTIELRRKGFELIEFTDPIEFRYAYESKYRSVWDQNQTTDLVVILHLIDSELELLPYDILKAGRKVSFSLGQIFPNFSYRIIESLDHALLDDLYLAQSSYPPDRMGDVASMDYVLRHVFGIASELILNEVDLLRTLLRIHYSRLPLPANLNARLSVVLQNRSAFKDWPLDLIISDEQAFFSFLQERWPIFVEDRIKSSDEVLAKADLRFPGSSLLPFDHHDIKVYIDNLFAENKLQPLSLQKVVPNTLWLQCGILQPNNKEAQITRLFETTIAEPDLESRYTDWVSFALKWAELAALVFECEDEKLICKLKERSCAININFINWLMSHYASLINLSPASPAMLHQVPRFLSRTLESKATERVALLVMDGLSLDQWVAIRKILSSQNNEFEFRESAVFAWVPTLTSVSRQALFSGKPPYYFAQSLKSTSGEERLWRLFWETQDVSRQDIAYIKSLSDGEPAVIDKVINPGKTIVAGLVVDMVDQIMHGVKMGSCGMHSQIRQWVKKGFPSALINRLFDYGYEVWLTSDHGNIECTGQGKPSEGVLAESQGQRARIYSNQELRAKTATSFPFAYQWSCPGLPDDFYPLLAGGHDAFAPKGEQLLAHGGLSIEEVIVPFVKIERRND